MPTVRHRRRAPPRSSPSRARRSPQTVPSLAKQAITPTARSLNGPIGPHRRWAWTDGKFEEFKAVRTALGGTVNDVVLTAITARVPRPAPGPRRAVLGEARRPLDGAGVGARGRARSGSLNNQVSGGLRRPAGRPRPTRVDRLAVDPRPDGRVQEDDAGRRRAARSSRWATTSRRPCSRWACAPRCRPARCWCQAVTTNVPGPRIPLYVLGRRMRSAHAYVPIAGGTRCSIGIFSYLNTMTFGINADFDGYPDVDVLSGGIRRGIEELLDRCARATQATATARRTHAGTKPARRPGEEAAAERGEPGDARGRERSARARAGSTSRPASAADRRRHRPDRHVRLRADPAAPGRRPRSRRVIGIARRPFDPAERGWTKMEYRQGDVRDPDALREAFDGADVVVHLAFLITGNASRRDDPGDQRRRHAQRVPGRGGRRCPPVRLRLVGRGLRLPRRQPGADRRGLAGAPGGPAVLRAGEGRAGGRCCEARRSRTPSWRSTCCARRSSSGPNVVGGKDVLPGPLAPLGRRLFGRPAAAARARCRCSCRAPAAVHPRGGRRPRAAAVHRRRRPAGRLQHRRRRRRHRGRRRPGVRRAADPRCRPARRRPRPARSSRLPFLPPVAEWIEAASRPVIMDTTKAREQLGWRPRYTGLEALRDTLRDGPDRPPGQRPAGGAAVAPATARTSAASRSGTCSCGTWPTPAQLEVPPGRVPAGDVAGGRDGDQPVVVALDQQHRRRRSPPSPRGSGAGRPAAAAASGRRPGRPCPCPRRPRAPRSASTDRSMTSDGSVVGVDAAQPQHLADPAQRRLPRAAQPAGTAPRRTGIA